MEFSEIVMKRYATRMFDGKKVPDGKVHALMEMIRFAPSSLNLQPWKIVVVTDQKVKEELQKASWDQPQIGTCSHLLVFCADTGLENLSDRLEAQLTKNGMPEKARQGYLGMVRGFVSGLKKEDRLPWAQKQVYIALGNALNGATSLGFDSCPMEGFDPAAYSRILKLPANIVPTVLAPIGYANDTPRPKLRFPGEDVFI